MPNPTKPAPPFPLASDPAPEPDLRERPHPITFFVSGRERSSILRALRRLDGDRVFALKRALGLV
ncbi:MAG: hypothetical protein IPJ41_18550 [Phycisphaerales bacterium]|nr:hypothetical protein [Phycisphaerales bacterium]